jgi:N utilization substance protein B
MGDPAENISPKAKALSARLSSVQAVYQIMQNEERVDKVIEEYYDRAGMEIDGEKLVMPDGALLKKIVTGVAERRQELDDLVKANLRKKGEGQITQDPEALIQAILLCGAYEILAHNEIDSPIIINDYLHVTHGFFDGGEAGLVNGVLDSIAKILRI